MMGNGEKSVEIILDTCMRLKPKEKVLIVTDKNMEAICHLFMKKLEERKHPYKLIRMEPTSRDGAEPPQDVAEAMKRYDVEFLITSRSLTHTRARKEASKTGARIATLPGIRMETFARAIDVDYEAMTTRTLKLITLINKGAEMRVTANNGTNLRFSIKGREGHGSHPGLYHKKGQYGNLPDGEAFVAPLEGTSNGMYIVDASVGGLGKVDKPVKITVKDGYAVKIEGGKSAAAYNALLDKVGKEARNIAEFGIGTNEKAIICGSLLEDEKVMGTAHIALGNNSGFGGKVDVPLHIDGVFLKPSIWIDEKQIMDNGKLLVR